MPPNLKVPTSSSSFSTINLIQQPVDLPVSMSHFSLKSTADKLGIPMDDLIALLDQKLSFNDFFEKHSIEQFYDETDKDFIIKNPSKETQLNQWIRDDFEEFINTIRRETMKEVTLSNGQTLRISSISGPMIQFHTGGLTVENIHSILHHTKNARIGIPIIPQIDHVVQLLYDYIRGLNKNTINTFIKNTQSLKQSIQSNKKPILDLVLTILESITKNQTIYRLLTIIRNNPTIYHRNLIIGLTTDKLITEIQLILKIPFNIGFRHVQPMDIYNTIEKMIQPQNERFIQQYEFKLMDRHSQAFLVQALFKKPLMDDGIPFLKKSMLFPNVSLLFEDLSIQNLTMYRCKIKTTYSDIIEIMYLYNRDKPNEPLKINVKVIKNPLSLGVYLNYPQIIQTYYCFYLLNNPLFILQIIQLLNPTIQSQTRRPYGNSILSKYRLNGGIRREDIQKAQEIDRQERMKEMKEMNQHFLTMMKDLQTIKKKEVFQSFLDAYVNHLRLVDEQGKIYCIYETFQCINNRFTSGGKKALHKK